MVLVCKDLTYDNNSLAKKKLMSVNFDNETSLPSTISREMDESSMNQYRSETNGFGITYTETLNFEIHIMKQFDEFTSQNELEFTPEEYDDLVLWLSSPQTHKWLDITTENNINTKVKGYFSSIEPYENWGICYGARCTFNCNSPYSYIEKTHEDSVTGVKNFILNNESSELYDYVYPNILIEPTKNEEIFIHNLSDSEIIDNGNIPQSEDSDVIVQLQDKISSYASTHNLTVEYMIDDETKDIKLICNGNGLLFYMTDSYGISNKYVAYYLQSDSQYYICRGGFFYCNLLQALNVTLDCKNLAMYDSLERPVLFTEIGIQDEDEIYWPRLVHGNNSIRVYGNFNISINYLEPRKGLLI